MIFSISREIPVRYVISWETSSFPHSDTANQLSSTAQESVADVVFFIQERVSQENAGSSEAVVSGGTSVVVDSV